MSQLLIVEHPLLQESLARLRDKDTPPEEFRKNMESAGLLLGLRALEELKTHPGRVETPLRTAVAHRVKDPIVLTVILRAGLGLLPEISRALPRARIGHIGLYRNEETLNPIRYYVRLPKGLKDSFVLLLDPMLATGGSAAEAIRILKTDGARHIVLVSLVATKTGIRRVHRDHPDVRIVVAAVDPILNKHGYIVPGLGDAGDRLFGTT
ncbi:MAG TPA: uracil phosphoribosyltransferase [Elusimicrobia bacterium]|nr:uracil phosphoribosyltransferase [Elusimicrobiota bacterium]